MQWSLWTPKAKKSIENNVALENLIHCKIRLAFLSTANFCVLGLTGNQLAKDVWPLGSYSIFNNRKLTKNRMHIRDFFGLKHLTQLENLGEKNICI